MVKVLTQEFYKQVLPWVKANRWFIGLSGGMDSTVLLHLLVMLRKNYVLPEMTAIYIHHGLQQVADDWALHCQHLCQELAIPLHITRVKVPKRASLEEAARDARYQAFSELLKTGDVLFTAQHQNDQAETLMFRLVRGAGVRGLAGIPKQRKLGLGELVRPLLSFTHKQLKDYALANALQWIEDPTNQDIHYARNYLRHKVIPVLQQQWPSVITNIGQATCHLQEAQQLLTELALQDLQEAQVKPLYAWLTPPSLLLEPLTRLSLARQKNALSCWLSRYVLVPNSHHWQGWQQLIAAKEDANPIWQLQHAELHRANGRIWLLSGHWLEQPVDKKLPITTNPIQLENNGQVILAGQLPSNSVALSYRQGGEVIELANRGRRDLKRLFNEQAIPPFVRNRIPLLVDQQGKLLAVANFPQWHAKTVSSTLIFKWVPNDY